MDARLLKQVNACWKNNIFWASLGKCGVLENREFVAP